MDVMKIRYDKNNCNIKISNIPDNHTFFALNNGDLYYLGFGTFGSNYIPELKPEFNYYASFKVYIQDDILRIYYKLYFIAFNEGNSIDDKVYATVNNRVKRLYETNLSNLIAALDVDSINGRKVLLQNIIPGYTTRDDNLPELFITPTKDADLTFCYEDKDFDSYYVPLDSVVGFNHPSYTGSLSWVENFFYLNRFNDLMYNFFINTEYYSQLESGSIEPEDLSFDKIDDEYYISQGAHRITMAILLKKKGIYAPVKAYKTALFYKDCYEKISKFGFNVELYGKKFNAYNDMIENYNRKDYEAFKITIGTSYLLLLNEDMMIEFIDTYINFEKFNIKVKKLLSILKNIYYNYIKQQNADDIWYMKFISDAVNNFFVNNYEDIRNLKLQTDVEL